MPTENEKSRQNQNRDSSGDPKRGGMGQQPGRPAPESEYEKEPGQGKRAGSDERSPWRDRDEGDNNRDERDNDSDRR
jgi:hypothetical protein